jgi:palmitoyltransferase
MNWNKLSTFLIHLIDISILPRDSDAQCTILKADLCATVNADTYTIILTIWATLQLIWVVMLLTVQLLQIGRGLTTFEAMQPSKPHAVQPFTSFVTTGDPSLSSAGMDSGNRGPDPAAPPGHVHKPGALEAWKRLLGVDAFVAVALHGRGSPQANQASRYRNPFSRGCITNCKDFWADDGPLFGSRDSGAAKFGGETVDYTNMYEVPQAMGYAPVQGEDDAV